MRLLRSRALWGVLLVFAGGLLLLQALDVFAVAGFLWTALVCAAGLAFLYAFISDRGRHWWAAIPGFALLGLAAVAAWNGLVPGAEERGGALFLGGVGLGFVAVYLADHGRWWAVIPGGAILTLALVAGLSSSVAETTTAGMLFLGLAATFGLLAVLPAPGGRMRWPIIPSAVLVLVGALVTLQAAAVLGFVWPVALILGGLYLIFRAFGSGGGTGRPA